MAKAGVSILPLGGGARALTCDPDGCAADGPEPQPACGCAPRSAACPATSLAVDDGVSPAAQGRGLPATHARAAAAVVLPEEPGLAGVEASILPCSSTACLSCDMTADPAVLYVGLPAPQTPAAGTACTTLMALPPGERLPRGWHRPRRVGLSPPAATVRIANLPRVTTDNHLWARLRGHGATRIYMPRDGCGRTSGVALSQLATEDDVGGVLAYNGNEYGGRVLQVRRISARRTMRLRPLPPARAPAHPPSTTGRRASGDCDSPGAQPCAPVARTRAHSTGGAVTDAILEGNKGSTTNGAGAAHTGSSTPTDRASAIGGDDADPHDGDARASHVWAAAAVVLSEEPDLGSVGASIPTGADCYSGDPSAPRPRRSLRPGSAPHSGHDCSPVRDTGKPYHASTVRKRNSHATDDLVPQDPAPGAATSPGNATATPGDAGGNARKHDCSSDVPPYAHGDCLFANLLPQVAPDLGPLTIPQLRLWVASVYDMLAADLAAVLARSDPQLPAATDLECLMGQRADLLRCHRYTWGTGLDYMTIGLKLGRLVYVYKDSSAELPNDLQASLRSNFSHDTPACGDGVLFVELPYLSGEPLRLLHEGGLAPWQGLHWDMARPGKSDPPMNGGLVAPPGEARKETVLGAPGEASTCER